MDNDNQYNPQNQQPQTVPGPDFSQVPPAAPQPAVPPVAPQPTVPPMAPEPIQTAAPVQPVVPIQPSVTVSPMQGSYSPAGGMVNPTPTTFQPPKKKLPVLLIVIIAIVVLLGGGAAAYFMTRDKGQSNNNNTPPKSNAMTDTQKAESTAPADKESVTAAKASELRAVCQGKKVSNAADYQAPYKLALFNYNNGSWSQSIASSSSDTDFKLLATDPSEATTVICNSPETETAQAAISCTMQDLSDGKGTNNVTKQMKPVTYKYTAYQAKTGETITSGTVASGTTCPTAYGGIETEYMLLDQTGVDTIFKKLGL